MTIPDEAVQAAMVPLQNKTLLIPFHVVKDALKSALPFLQGVKVKDAPNLTRPLIGIENRTAQEVFDIMCDRIMSAIEPAPSPRAQALEEAAQVAYRVCAEIRHITLGDKAAAAIRALSSQHVLEQHTDDIAVDRFANAMKIKLKIKRAQGRGGWEDKKAVTREYLSYLLLQNCLKGSTLNVANLAMMLHQRGEEIIIDEETAIMVSAGISSQPVATALPQDVINLVIAARDAFDAISGCGIGAEIEADLDSALKPFSSRVPYENEPDDLPASPGASE
ncbi:hypothetical protein LQT97_00770 [Brucella pseudogrignonensis]|uniref:hypothetical protein n=1 Tax=Brucella pseudogrignonensis TaxID=419475 RepID=UPI001E492BCB|nr:hypothetical protein [Brucella pseudogrignonensis]MCD4509757.1 hypothetical protein [Brucella pseudogrignonensis]